MNPHNWKTGVSTWFLRKVLIPITERTFLRGNDYFVNAINGQPWLWFSHRDIIFMLIYGLHVWFMELSLVLSWHFFFFQNCLLLLDATVRYGGLPSEGLQPLIVTLCRTVNIEKFCQLSWKVKYFILVYCACVCFSHFDWPQLKT